MKRCFVLLRINCFLYSHVFCPLEGIKKRKTKNKNKQKIEEKKNNEVKYEMSTPLMCVSIFRFRE